MPGMLSWFAMLEGLWGGRWGFYELHDGKGAMGNVRTHCRHRRRRRHRHPAAFDAL